MKGRRSGGKQTAVNKVAAPDYHVYVDAANEMHLQKIERKIRSVKYASAAELRADFNLILSNAKDYNSPGRGKFGGEGAAPLPPPLHLPLSFS